MINRNEIYAVGIYVQVVSGGFIKKKKLVIEFFIFLEDNFEYSFITCLSIQRNLLTGNKGELFRSSPNMHPTALVNIFKSFIKTGEIIRSYGQFDTIVEISLNNFEMAIET